MHMEIYQNGNSVDIMNNKSVISDFQFGTY